MKYPHLLQPVDTEEVKLPSGSVVQIPKATPHFEVWSGKPVTDTYGNKPILRFGKRPAFAELVVLRILLGDDWNGVWVDTYRSALRTEYWPKNSVEIPTPQQRLLDRIYTAAGSRKGCWDVFCWKGRTRLFAELKRRGRDRIQDTQRRWLGAALNCGLSPTSFLVIEWSEKPTTRSGG